MRQIGQTCPVAVFAAALRAIDPLPFADPLYQLLIIL